jgi:CheY-like chemotaxis protein
MTLTVLIVDDEPATHTMLRMIFQLKRPQWTVLTAERGQAALDIVASQTIDFLLLDISMPEMDGLEVCKRLRETPEYANLPIAIFTALDTVDRRERANAVGATAFWVKPFQPAEFIPEIERLVANASSQPPT